MKIRHFGLIPSIRKILLKVYVSKLGFQIWNTTKICPLMTLGALTQV